MDGSVVCPSKSDSSYACRRRFKPCRENQQDLNLFAKPSPKPSLRSEEAELEETRRELGEKKSKPKPKLVASRCCLPHLRKIEYEFRFLL